MSQVLKRIDEVMGDSLSVPYIQSANSLFHFMRKLEYLEDKLRNKCIVPRYVPEEAEHYNIPGLFDIAFPMICFCDIRLSHVLPHTGLYGEYAISFSKKWALTKDVQPVHYINEKSDCFVRFTKALAAAYEVCDDQQDLAFEKMSDSLIYTMAYMKRLTGIQGNERTNFHDEQEWRYIPNLDTNDIEMPLFLDNIREQSDLKENYNEALKESKGVKLSFDYSDVQYILVANRNDRDNMIRVILDLEAEEMEKHILISKIFELSTLKGDV